MANQLRDVTVDPYTTYEELRKEQDLLLRELFDELYQNIPMANELWEKCLKKEYDLVCSRSRSRNAIEELCDITEQLRDVIGYYFYAMGVFQGIEISKPPQEQMPAVLN